MKIYKYPLQLTPEQVLEVPMGFNPLAVQLQANQLCLWAEVEPDIPASEEVIILVVGTGHAVRKDIVINYIGTVQMDIYVWHIYWSRP